MQVIILTGPGGTRVRLGRVELAWGVAALTIALVAALVAGFWFGIAERPLARADSGYDQAVAWLYQHQEISRAAESASAQIEVLSVRTAALQARLARLDALGRELVNIGGIDPNELPFDPVPLASRPAEGTPERLMEALARLENLLDDREIKLRGLEQILLVQRVHNVTAPSGRPVGKGWIASRYGMRDDPVSGRVAFHDGVDFAGRYKSPVVAVASGVVSIAGQQHGYGNIVQIEHGAGVATRYAHNQKNLVKNGDAVTKGEVIALMGTTGRSTGSHVHFEVWRDGKAVDPLPFVVRP